MSICPTLAAWSAAWLRESAPRWRPNTARNYVAVLRVYWLPEFGDVPLEALCRKELRAHLLRLASEGLATRTVGNALGVLRSCLSGAVDAELIVANPALGLGRALGRNSGVRRVLVPRGEQLRALVRAAAREVPEYHAVIATMALAGLRIGEACGLQWPDVDLEARLLRVRRTVGDVGEGPTKSGRERLVDVGAVLAGLLGQQPRRCLWVFPRTDAARPLDQRLVNQAIRRAAEAAGIDGYVTAHALRHGYTSTLIEQGAHLEWLRAQLGHSDLRLISTVYGRHAQLHDLAALDRLDGTRRGR